MAEDRTPAQTQLTLVSLSDSNGENREAVLPAAGDLTTHAAKSAQETDGQGESLPTTPPRKWDGCRAWALLNELKTHLSEDFPPDLLDKFTAAVRNERERDLNTYGARFREACKREGWRVDGLFPDFTVQSLISVKVDSEHSVAKTIRRCKDADLSTVRLIRGNPGEGKSHFMGVIRLLAQRLGRGNRRSDRSEVYGICRDYPMDGSWRGAEEDLFFFLALAAAMREGEMEMRTPPEFYSVMTQQALSLAYKYQDEGIYADLLVKVLDPLTAQFAPPSLVNHIFEELERKDYLTSNRRDALYYPSERLLHLIELAKMHSNIASRQHAAILQGGEDKWVPLSEVPREYASRLEGGKVFVSAGKPRMVTGLERGSEHFPCCSDGRMFPSNGERPEG